MAESRRVLAERSTLRLTNGIPAIGLATIIALAGITAQAAPVAATDPSPSPVATVSPAPTTTTDPSPSPTADPSASPDPSATPDPAASPDPSASPAPTASPDPSPTPTPTADPSAAPVSGATATTTTTAVVVRVSRGSRIARIALRQRGDRYVRGAVGPNAFDCSGLVRYAYRKAGVSRRLGGGHSARGMLTWGRLHHRTSRHHPHIGDVVIYGNGTHAGIYIGHGRIVSALNPRLGIRVTRLHALGDPFTTFIHTHV